MNKPKARTKIIEVGGNKYRLGKMNARDASYLAMRAAAIVAPALTGGKVKMDVESVTNVLPHISRSEFDEIQTMLLRTVYLLVDANGTDIPQPILRADGAFVNEDLAYDARAVIELTAQALIFNVGDFFQGDGLKLMGK